ncbi:MAG TPA: hypothetical protein PKA05_02235 [Roseiflexaceae bacterium]|nr:hypothetical protein [Roseiflexaceae bacterium]HMP39173.1 hypothetical protein [Roseiflexaceae bacterium]
METDTAQQLVKFVMLGLMLSPFAILGLSVLNTWLTEQAKGPREE